MRPRLPALAALLALSLSSCGKETATCPADQVRDAAGECTWDVANLALVPLDDTRLLRRLSLDLRGTLPSLDELQRVQADPAELDVLTQEYLASPELEERLVHRLQERWHTRIDLFHVFFPEYPELADEEHIEYAFERAVGEEPLRLLAHIIASDRPWTDAVLTEDAMADEILEQIWPLERRSSEPGWQLARWTDGRPAVGVLASNGLWWRYVSTVTNYNRLRVAAIMRLLICEDIQGRPISFAELPALADGDSLEEALRTTPACMGCHSNVDPIAANLFGFWVGNEHSSVEVDRYHTEREPLGAFLMQVEPAWFGTPTANLREMAVQLAADPRYAQCAVESTAEMLWRRSPGLDDHAVVSELLEVYEESGSRMHPVYTAVTQTRRYRAGSFGGRATEADREREVLDRLMTGDTLSSALEELTGWTWTYEGFEQLDNDSEGHRLLVGTVDGNYQTRPQQGPSLTWALVHQRASEAAAAHVVAQDLDGGEDRRLLTRVDLETRPGGEAFEAQLGDLALRLWGLPLDEARLGTLSELWTAASEAEAGEAGHDAARAAWAAVLTAMLLDPDFGRV